METQIPSPVPPAHSGKKRILTVIFFLLNTIIFIGLWILFKIVSPLKGYGQTTVDLSNLVITLFILFLLSVFLSAHLTYAVRQGLIVALPGSPLDRLVKFWNKLAPPYDVKPILEETAEPGTEAEMQEGWLKEFTPTDVDEMLEFIVNQKGRGRKSYTPDDRRFHAVHDWILMQMKGTSVRLQDFLDERFDFHPDGSPKVPRDTFYGWYRKFKKMLKEYKAIKQA
jgi:hypothetical protein